MKTFYSQRINDKLDAEAAKSDTGKWVKLRFHEASVGAEFLLKRDELVRLRDFLDKIIVFSETGVEVLQEDTP